MPRPKVRKEDRRRTLRACDLCKAAKIRCDSNVPCQACVKRGRTSSCVYPENAPNVGPQSSRGIGLAKITSPQEDQYSSQEQDTSPHFITSVGPGIRDYETPSKRHAPAHIPSRTPVPVTQSRVPTKAAWVPSSQIIGSRTLTSLKGEKS